MSAPERKRPHRRPLLECHNRAEIVFLTVCTAGRKPLLARPEVHELLVATWSAPENHWAVGRYVIMPDHLHLFCAPARTDALELRRWVAYWKSLATRDWPFPGEAPIWQPDVWDRQLRSGESYDEKWDYVVHNPVRHGLVAEASQWPYQGEIQRLEWHD